MTGERDRAGASCVVVGGGVAGLSCALRLARLGHEVRVLEAESDLGGRARTDWHRGRPVDRGFQSLFRSYPEARSFLGDAGIPRRDLRPFAAGVVFIGPEGPRRLSARPGALSRFAGLAPRERARLGRLAAEVARRSPRHLLDVDDPEPPSTEQYLRDRGFAEEAIDGFFRPLFGAMLLDHTLAADAGYFRFLLCMLARGAPVIPSDGLGMLSDWSAAAIRQLGGAVEAGARVEGIEPDAGGHRAASLRLADERRVKADWFVLATDAPAARRLLEPVDAATAERVPREATSTVTATFALSRPLYAGRSVLVNAAPRPAAGPCVDIMCQTTNVVRPGVPEGPHILLATCVTTDGRSADGLVDEVGRQVAAWAPQYRWEAHAEPLEVVHHDFAGYRPLPGVRAALPGPRTALHNLILAGDVTRHPSIEGAVDSGHRAAGVVDALSP